VTAFIRFKHRFYGEYAREAMQNQSILGNEVITIKWAYEDPNPQANKLVLNIIRKTLKRSRGS
jgi:hypothetical protein